jgi:hypothetical protein
MCKGANHREIWVPKWTAAFIERVHDLTGQMEFTYVLAVTRMNGEWNEEVASEEWSQHPRIAEALNGRPMKFLTLETMWHSISGLLSI